MYRVIPIEDIPKYRAFHGDGSSKWVVVINKQLPSSLDRYTIDGDWYTIVSTHPTKGSADKALRKLNKTQPESGDYPYQLFITESQAQVLVDALDLYSRIGAGQLEEVAHVLRLNPGTQHEKFAAVEELTKEAANCWMGRAGGHHGIFQREDS